MERAVGIMFSADIAGIQQKNRMAQQPGNGAVSDTAVHSRVGYIPCSLGNGRMKIIWVVH